jgi:hypothetical protein
MTLNTAVMIMIYNRKNNLGFAEAKFLFRTEKGDDIMVLGIHLSDGIRPR